MKSLIITFCLSLTLSINVWSQSLAPNGPGADAQWATAGKQAIGTANSPGSKVWFTLALGVLTEVYYPDVMTANVHLMQFIVVDPFTKKVETELDDAIHEVKVLRPDSLTFQQINTARSGKWKIIKTYVADTRSDSVLIDVKFTARNKDLVLYAYFDPSMGNSGLGDHAETLRSAHDGSNLDAFLFTDAGSKSNNAVLSFSSPLAEQTVGYYGSADAFEQLRQFGKIKTPFDIAKDGNVMAIAKILSPQHFISVVTFGRDPLSVYRTQFDLLNQRKFVDIQSEYEKGWADYVKTLPKVDPKYQAQFNMAAMVLKSHEDKKHLGANIASLSIPWGGGANANENNVGGYHLVWSRDLYQVATAYIALGDKAAAERALDFVLTVQQKPDGSLPQNSKLDGSPFWNSLQMDEVAFPLILAWQLGRTDRKIYQKHIKLSADFIVTNGPATPQERWEEEGGYSPSTIAAEIAGLVCAADIARKNGDNASADLYLKTADEWQANIEKWTVTKTGKLSKQPYYLRITANGKPDSGDNLELNNGAGTFDEREIVDAGFLELVRLGIKPADDPIIINSLKVIDDTIRVKTPNGDAFYRYNHDGYGEMPDGRRWNWDGKYSGKGRLWPLLSGERGEYEIALANVKYSAGKGASPDNDFALSSARLRLENLLGFANDGMMIPEQVWDQKAVPANVDKQFIPELKFGEGTGSATPLAWSMAQFIRLATDLKAGKNLDTPSIVYDRYVKKH